MEAEADFETWCNAYCLYVQIPRIFYPYFKRETGQALGMSCASIHEEGKVSWGGNSLMAQTIATDL
jgi:hypothetical protein